MVMYNYALSSSAMEQKSDLYNNSLLNFHQLPKKYFTMHEQYPTVTFLRTTVYYLILYPHLNSKNLENLIINEAI